MKQQSVAMDGTFTDKDVARQLEYMLSERTRRNLTWEMLGKEIGVNGSSLSSFASTYPKGTYQGDVQKMVGNIAKWRNDESNRLSAAQRRRFAPEFVSTPTCDLINTSLAYAQYTPAITTLVGVPGIGKTKAAMRYKAQHPNVIMATMEPLTSGAGMALHEIAIEMGVEEKCHAKLPRTIGTAVRGTGALIIIDEAQHLDVKALDQIRSLHDKWGVGLAFLGNETLIATIDGNRRNSTAQIKSRMGMRRVRTGLIQGDACALIDAWGVTDEAAKLELKRIAGKSGALRNIHMVMSQVSLAQVGSQDSLEVTAELIRSVWSSLHPKEQA